MDQEKIDKLIKEHSGVLRQLTDLNNRVKELEKKEKELMKSIEMGNRRGFERIEGFP